MAASANNGADESPTAPPAAFWKRRGDQAVVAIVAAVSLVAMVGYLTLNLRGGRLIELDRAAPSVAKFQVDVNPAQWIELVQLPEIGETLAQRIIESREQNGPFQTWDQLRRVRGIGPRTLERIKPYLRPIAPSH